MPFLIGTDEAGYGPNLGPLVITATLWEVPFLQVDLYESLKMSVADSATPDRITVCDSKDLYQSSGSIRALETSVLSLLGRVPSEWKELVRELGCPRSAKDEEFWLTEAELKLPLRADSEIIQSLTEQFANVCHQQEVKLLEIRTATLFADQFNESVASQGNKATVLTSTTLSLVDQMMKHTGNSAVKIVCDKHGGRSKYAGVLQHFLTDHLVEIFEESLESSRYGWTDNDRDVRVEFNSRGEAALPVALASMVSKYVREVYMNLWNQFWLGHLPSLKPTKGYPQDAKRFMLDIDNVRNRLNISRESVWRCR